MSTVLELCELYVNEFLKISVGTKICVNEFILFSIRLINLTAWRRNNAYPNLKFFFIVRNDMIQVKGPDWMRCGEYVLNMNTHYTMKYNIWFDTELYVVFDLQQIFRHSDIVTPYHHLLFIMYDAAEVSLWLTLLFCHWHSPSLFESDNSLVSNCNCMTIISNL